MLSWLGHSRRPHPASHTVLQSTRGLPLAQVSDRKNLRLNHIADLPQFPTHINQMEHVNKLAPSMPWVSCKGRNAGARMLLPLNRNPLTPRTVMVHARVIPQTVVEVHPKECSPMWKL